MQLQTQVLRTKKFSNDLTPQLQKEKNRKHTILFDLNGVLFGQKQTGFVSAVVRPVNILESFQLLEDCKRQGHKLLIVSNWSSESIDFVKDDPQCARLFSYFSDIIVADKVGIKKPDPRIFDYIMVKHEVDPQTCIFIDDKAVNLEGAKQAGIQKGILCKDFDFKNLRKELENHGAL